MRIAVVGCGYIARVHLTALRQVEEARAAADWGESRSKERTEEFGIGQVEQVAIIETVRKAHNKTRPLSLIGSEGPRHVANAG
jgi:predicted dehydrogenase